MSAKYACHAPLVGVVLAGEYTAPAIDQLRNIGFYVVHIDYPSVLSAFRAVGMDAASDEKTEDAEYSQKVARWMSLSDAEQLSVSSTLAAENDSKLNGLWEAIRSTIARRIARVVVLPLHGAEQSCRTVEEAITYIHGYNAGVAAGPLVKYEVQIHYTNKDKVIGEFRDKAVAVDFLRNYLPSVELRGNLPVDTRSVVIGGTPESLPEPLPKPDPPKRKRTPKKK